MPEDDPGEMGKDVVTTPTRIRRNGARSGRPPGGRLTRYPESMRRPEYQRGMHNSAPVDARVLVAGSFLGHRRSAGNDTLRGNFAAARRHCRRRCVPDFSCLTIGKHIPRAETSRARQEVPSGAKSRVGELDYQRLGSNPAWFLTSISSSPTAMTIKPCFSA